MNIVAVLVAGVSVLWVPFACARLLSIVSQAIRASRAGNSEQEKALVRDLLGLIGLTLCMGLAGFRAVTEPAVYDVTGYSQMSRREQRQLEFGVLWSGVGLVFLVWYALKQRRARQRQRNEEAVAQAIEDSKAENKQG